MSPGAWWVLGGLAVGAITAMLLPARRGRAPGLDASARALAGSHPTLIRLALSLVQKAWERFGIELVVTDGYRSEDEQAALYAQGRTAPGAIVTDAPPGGSFHEYGLAFDVAVLDDNDKPSWPAYGTISGRALWDRVGALGTALGLDWGARFGDYPHFTYRQGLTLAQIKAGRRPA
jgi:peptidoglycan L-alanyl-D-glutamate endopeptidase CwlK